MSDVVQGEWYIQEAWNIFRMLTTWMHDTKILTVHGVDITFMNLLLFGIAFRLILALIEVLLPGWFGKEEDDYEAPYNPINYREEDDSSYVYGEAPHGWKQGRWERF